MSTHPRRRRALGLLLVALTMLVAVVGDWLVVPWGYPIATAYGIPVLIAAILLDSRTVLIAAVLAPALSVPSDVLQGAPPLSVAADGGSLFAIGLLAYWVSIHQREMQRARAESEAARAHAERIGRHLRMQYEVARALGEAHTLPEAARAILPTICAQLDWSCGLLWTIEPVADRLRCEYAWSKPDRAVATFAQHCLALDLERGVGLPGSVWGGGQPRWVSDVQRDSNFPRLAVAGKAGLHTGLGFPIRLGDQVLGVMELFARDIRPADETVLALLAATGSQIGQFLERRNAEQQIVELLASEQAAHARAAEAVQQRDVLLTAVSHDLRGPLTALIGSAQLLRRQAQRDETPVSEHVQQGVERIETVTRRMRRLVDGLLDMAVVEEGQPLPLRREPTDLHALVQRIIAERRLAAPGREIRVEAGPDPMVGDWDASRLERVVDNLVGNALKYSPDDAAVLVSLRVDDEPGQRRAVLEVRDRGIGIPAADLPYIFDRFRRGANVSTATAGLGIGLAGTRAIVLRHGGSISMESELGRGSVCTVRLPLAAAEAEVGGA